MKNVMLLYPPGKLYQRAEDRAQSNIDDSTASSVHACNDLGYCAAILLKKGYNVFLRDYQTEKSTAGDVKADILRFKPELIVISTTNATIKIDLDFINSVLTYHNCRFVLKSAIFYDVDEELLNRLDFSHVSCLVGGEIDTVIGKVADGILFNNVDLSTVPGIIYHDGDSFKKTGFYTWECDLDSIPFPARNLMNNSLYTRPDTGEAMATIYVSRGCPSQCIYCLTPIISGRHVRFRSIENVFAEIEECYRKYSIRNFFFRADTFTIDREWAEKLCDRIINSDLHGKIEFTVNSRADTISEELLDKLKEAGCFTIAIGFESGNAETLKKIKKGTTIEKNLEAARLVKKSGIPLFAFFMIGFPWETHKHINDTFNLIFKINPDFIELHIALPYYGTELFDLCKSYGTLAGSTWGFDYFNPNTKGTATIPLEEIKKLKSRFLLRFYLRPSYICKRLIDCAHNPVIFKNYFSYGMKLVKKNVFKRKSSK